MRKSTPLRSGGFIVSFTDVFGTTNHVTWAQELARAVLVFAYGLALVRLAGRRVFAQWSALDIIVAIVTGSSLSRALTGAADLLGTLAAMTLLIGLHWALTQVSARSVRLSALLEGGSVALGEGGRIDGRTRIRHGVSASNLEEALRSAGLRDMSDASLVVLEPSGKISILKHGPAASPREDPAGA